jgi:hypothetical protein
LTICSIRRSAMLPSSATAIAARSRAMATGCPWKLPPETMSAPSGSTNTSGLSVAADISVSSTRRAKPRPSRVAPWTWGMQRKEYASWTLWQSAWDSTISDPSVSRHSAAAASMAPG